MSRPISRGRYGIPATALLVGGLHNHQDQTWPTAQAECTGPGGNDVWDIVNKRWKHLRCPCANCTPVTTETSR